MHGAGEYPISDLAELFSTARGRESNLALVRRRPVPVAGLDGGRQLRAACRGREGRETGFGLATSSRPDAAKSAVPLLFLAWTRLGRLASRFEALVAAVRAGRLPVAPAPRVQVGGRF